MLETSGKIEGVYVGLVGERGKTATDVIEIRLDGVAGDRHAGFTREAIHKDDYPVGTEIRNERQWSAVSTEDLDIIRQAMNLRELTADVLGANLCVSGILDFSHLPRGTKLVFADGCTLVVEGFNPPCAEMGNHIADTYKTDADGHPIKPNTFPKAAINNRGLVGVVDRAGSITKEEVLRVVMPR